jgi:hypothetical protein
MDEVGATPLSTTTFTIMTVSIISSKTTHRVNVIRHNNAILSVIRLRVDLLNVIVMSVNLLSVGQPTYGLESYIIWMQHQKRDAIKK